MCGMCWSCRTSECYYQQMKCAHVIIYAESYIEVLRKRGRSGLFTLEKRKLSYDGTFNERLLFPKLAAQEGWAPFARIIAGSSEGGLKLWPSLFWVTLPNSLRRPLRGNSLSLGRSSNKPLHSRN